MFALELNRDISVAEKLSSPLEGSFRRSVRSGLEQDQCLGLSAVMEQVSLSSTGDRWRFSLSSDGLYSVKLVRNAIDELFLPSSPVQTRWVKVVPIKVNIFSWRACRDYLPTRSNLSRRGINVVDISCPLCNEGVEEAAHIFLRCPLARGVLLRICRWWNVGYQD
ncbi:RNA-directed DNA polymerase, eukaryota, partial [Tanacetum coccineum]